MTRSQPSEGVGGSFLDSGQVWDITLRFETL